MSQISVNFVDIGYRTTILNISDVIICQIYCNNAFQTSINAASTTMPHDDHVEELFYSVPDDTRRRSQNPGREAVTLDRSLISSLQVRVDAEVAGVAA